MAGLEQFGFMFSKSSSSSQTHCKRNESTSESTKVVHSFQPDWLGQFRWLRHLDGKLFHSDCQNARTKSNAFVKGSTIFQCSALVWHRASDDHRLAVGTSTSNGQNILLQDTMIRHKWRRQLKFSSTQQQ